MRKIIFRIRMMFAFKSILRIYFSFLQEEYSFRETVDSRLVIPEWLINGIAYTNDKVVIVFSDNILEKRFTTIIYEVQLDFRIPFDKDCYFTLDQFLESKGLHIEANKLVAYNKVEEIKECIEHTIFWLKKYDAQLVQVR